MKKGIGCLAFFVLLLMIMVAIGQNENQKETERLMNTPLYENREYVEVMANDLIKQRLKDPDSYEFIDMEQQPTSKAGERLFLVNYRAKNGFGGYNVGEALFSCDKDNLKIISIKQKYKNKAGRISKPCLLYLYLHNYLLNHCYVSLICT